MVKKRRAQKHNNNNNNNGKETTKTRERKKQKIKHDDTDHEDSNSTTNLSQSQSWECPVSARKPLVAGSLKIESTSRRASLRSSKTKNIVETEIPDLFGCSNPQKSKEAFSSTHAIQQLDDLEHQVPQGYKREIEKGGKCVAEENTDQDSLDNLIAKMISPSQQQVEPNLRYREIEKAGKCVAIENADEDFLDNLIAKTKSPSQQVELYLRYREIEKGGKCVAIENADEGKEAEKEVPLADRPVDEDNEVESRERSLSNGQHITLDQFEKVSARIASFNTPSETGLTDLSKSRKHFSTTHDMPQLHNLAFQVPQSSQVESPRYLKQGEVEPSLRHEEIEKDGGFAAEGNLGDGIGEKQVSLVEKSISMVSLGITEFVKNMVVDEDDEVDSLRCDMDTIERYQVKPESMPILRKILTKYGDIAKNSKASTMLLTGSLETICGIISQMQGKHLRQIKEDFLIHNIGLVENIKNVGVNIEWLHVLLMDILDTKRGSFGKLKEEKESNKKIVDDVERRLTECRERQRELSDLLKSACDEEFVYKEALSKAKDERTRITQNIKSAKAKVERFLDCFPVDLLF